MTHKHTVNCYARNATGPLAYTPCREDGADRNLQNLKEVDFNAGLGLRGLRLVCNNAQRENTEMESRAYTKATEAFDKMHEAHSTVEKAKSAVKDAVDKAVAFRNALTDLPYTEDKQWAVQLVELRHALANDASKTIASLLTISIALDKVEVIK